MFCAPEAAPEGEGQECAEQIKTAGQLQSCPAVCRENGLGAASEVQLRFLPDRADLFQH